MPLLTQNYNISFAQGVDTKTDPKQVIPGKLLTLENGIFATRSEIRKRNGYLALGTAIEGSTKTVTSGAGLATFKNELNLFEGTEMYSYSESTGKWSDKGLAYSLNVGVTPVVRNTYQQTTPDSTYHPAGIQVFTWEDSRGGSRYSVMDASTGQLIVQDQSISTTALRPKPISIGQHVVIFFYDTSNGHLRYLPISILSPSIAGSVVDIATNVNGSNPHYDATVLAQRAFITYNNSDVGNGVSVLYMDIYLNTSSTLDVTGESASSCVSVCGDAVNEQVWVSYHNGTSVKYFIRDYNLSNTAVLAPTAVETVSGVARITGIASTGAATIYYEISAGSSYNTLVRSAGLTNTGTVTTPGVFLRSVGIGGKPFSYNGETFLTVTYQSVLQPTYFLVDSNARVAAKFAPSVGGGLLTKTVIPESNLIESGEYLVACLQKDLLTTVSGAVYTQTGVQACQLDFNSPNNFLRAEIGNNLHLTGGIVSMYDGNSLVEHGFHLYPENISVSTSTSGGSIGAGQFQYVITYEWTDNQGQTHRSSPSIPVQVTTTGSTSTNTLTIPTLRITAKQAPRTPVLIVVYRTVANGTIFYQISSITSPLQNSTTSDSVTYTDTAADSTIIGDPYVYTTGGVVENISAPAASLIATYQNRVVVVPSENPLSFWYSKQVVPGSPVEFSDLFTWNVDPRGGDITAIIQMDSNLILFKEEAILYMYGEGPDSTGANNDFSEAQLITTDGGCINPRSVVLTPAGLMYQSEKGIYLLGRNFEVSYIGADVEAYNSDTIVSGQLIPDTNQIRYCLDSGIALVYDYYFNQWSVFTNHDAVDATTFQGQFTYLQPGGTVMQESPGQFTDNGSFIKLRLVTSWLSLAQLQGYQRVRRILVLGDYISPHQLLVQVAYDFNPVFMQQDYINATALLNPDTYGADATYGSDSVYGSVADPQYQFRIHLQQQKCEAVQFSLEDVQSTNFGEGLSLSALGLEVGVKRGLNKVAPTRSFG